jgi:zinc protease
MRCSSLLLATIFISTLLPTGAVHALQPSWPQEVSDLAADPAAQFGQLANGLRYVVLPNQEPPGRASIRLYMDVGSLMEEDDQQGMAHFLEHMAFNGSRHFPSGEMVEYFQRLGMAFGADTNAHTSFEETVYKLELPKVEEPLLLDAMKLFRDYLDGMDLKASEIDRERGIILSEKLSRDSIDYRTMIEGYKFALPKAILPNRLPIGIEETIKAMPRERFVDFYETWYTPKRATIVAVGDFPDTNLVIQLIETHFKDAAPRRADAPRPDLGVIEPGRGLIAKLHTELEAKAVDLSIEVVKQVEAKPDTAAERRSKLIRSLADSMINQRFSKLAKQKDSPILSAQAYSYEYLDFLHTSGVGASCQPENWQPALALAEQELRRALQHGFTESEFAEATATILQQLKLRADQATSRRSRDLSDGLVKQLSARKVFTHPTADLERVTKELATITAADAHAALKTDWNTTDLQIFVGGKLKLEGDASAQIIDAYQTSTQIAVSAPTQEDSATFAYTDFGPAGKILSQTQHDDLEITQAVFENNVRVSIKPTPFEKGTIRVLVSFGGGKLTAPKDLPGIVPFAQSTFALGGLEAHDVDTLRRLFAAQTVSSDFSVGDEAFLLSGRTAPADLLSQLQLLTAHLIAPGYREEAEDQFRKNLSSLYTQLDHTAEGIMSNQVVSFLHQNDSRFGFPAIAEIEKRSLAELKAWLTPELSSSFLEVSVVGDVDPKAALDAIASTLGALPARAATKPSYTEQRAIKLPAPSTQDFTFTTEIPKAIAAMYWPTSDMSDIQRTRRLTVLSSVLDDRLRLKVREELGETYSPACYHIANDTFPGYGYVTAMIEVKPEQLDSIRDIVAEIGDDVAKGPITQDEFERAMQPLLSQLTQMRRDNRYWSQNVLRNAHEHPERLDWARALITDFEQIQLEEIQKLAAEFLPATRIITARIIPETK